MIPPTQITEAERAVDEMGLMPELPTPISDGETGDCICGATNERDVVPRAVATKLERDLTTARAELAQLRQQAAMDTVRFKEMQEAGDRRDAEVAALAQWKREQIAVESEWNPQELAKMLGATLGQSCRKVIQERAPILVAQVAALREALPKVQALVGWATDSEVQTIVDAAPAPAPPVVPLELAESLAGALQSLSDAVTARMSWGDDTSDKSRLDLLRFYKEANALLAAFRSQHPQPKGEP